MPDDLAAIRQAAQWFATLRDETAGEAEHARWRHWLSSSPEHAQAWQRVEAIHRPFAQILDPAQPTQPAQPARASAARKALEVARRAPRRRALRLLGVAGLLLGGGAAMRQLLPWRSWSYDLAAHSAAYRTSVGARQTLRLEDGTQLALNTTTAVDLAFDAAWRRVVLRDGEILVTTAADRRQPPRPLVIDTPHGRLTALGTRFAVRSSQASTRVSVFDGTVRVAPSGSTATRDLAAGFQSRFDAVRIEPEEPADPAREAWTRGVLIADNIRLDAFIAELARYTPVKLRVAEDVAALRLVGVYRMAVPAQDLPRVLLALEGTLPVRVRAATPHEVRIEAR